MWYVILLAGGSGSRMGAGQNKVLLSLNGETVISRSARAFAGIADGMVVVCRKEDESAIRAELAASQAFPGPIFFTIGGETRQASVLNGLRALPDSATYVLIHDGARCLVDEGTIRRAMKSAQHYGTGIAAIPAVDTIKQADKDWRITSTLDRSSLFVVQTPQAFETGLIRTSYHAARVEGYQGTDDASLMEHTGMEVHLSLGDRRNIKLTTPEDMAMARALLREAPAFPTLRVGQGYDVHRLVEGRALVLCGVNVPHTLGLLGHSDADVALHALMDAMLGAAALGDIGKHFPDTDERYKGISSMNLLNYVVALLQEKCLRVVNADITIVAQKPKLLPFIPQMRENVAIALGLPMGRVNVKATTTEHLAFEGREEGISAQAVCLLQEM